MSILGVVVRCRPANRAIVCGRLQSRPGVDIALDAGDGRLVLVIEDAVAAGAPVAAAGTLAEIAQWWEVLHTSLVYESFDAGIGDIAGGHAALDYRAWRDSLGGGAGRPAS